MNKRILSLAVISSLGVLAVSCSSGSGGDVATSPATTGTTGAAQVYTVKGTVPGTLIEAFCDNGAYYSTTSTQNGTNRHPFELTLPANLGCNLVMTTNENDPANSIVTPIGFIDANGAVSTRFSAAGDVVIDLDFISLYTDRSQTAGFDADDDGVIDTPYDAGTHADLSVKTAGSSTLDPDGDGIIEPYDDEDDDGIINRDDDDYSLRAKDRDRDGLADSIDVNPDNDENASNTYSSDIDADGDGYLDEDHDKDGYYDDDHDKDGYHDDDLDHDGKHDGQENGDSHTEGSGSDDHDDDNGSDHDSDDNV